MLIYEYLAAIVNSYLKNSDVPQLPDNISLSEIMDIASRNHISYMVYTALLKTNKFDEEETEYLRTTVKRDIYFTAIQLHELSAIVKGFEENGVKSMPLKGSILKYVYPRPELREMSDIDILIDSNDFDKADKVLKDLNYSLKHAIKHHDIYAKQEVIVEAHRSLYDKTVDNAQYKYFLGFDKAVLREGHTYIYDFKPEDFYVYMVAHAAKHFYAMGCGIRNLIDIYVYLNKYQQKMDLDYVKSELVKCGIYDFAVNMERLAFEWLDGKKFDDFDFNLFQYMMDAGIYGKDENGIWNKFAQAKDKQISSARLKLWYYFPPIYYVSEYYPWVEKHNWLLPVAWGVRIFRGVFLHKGRKKREMLRDVQSDKIQVYKQIYEKMNLRFSSH